MMQDPVLARKMFTGQKPDPQGKGITSVVANDEAPQQAMMQVAGAVDQFEQGIDSAQDPVQMMNVIRGDQQSEEQRRMELASVVGRQDALSTPLSVLTLVQPTMDLMGGKGIAALAQQNPQAAQAPPQAPAQGAQSPVQGYASGGLVGQVQGILGPERSLQDRMAERKALFAPTDSSSQEANLALMQYGAQVASTPGGLLQSLARPMGDFGKNLSGIAQRRAELEQKIASGALDAQEKAEASRQLAQINAATTQYQEGAQTGRTAMTIAGQAEQGRLNREFQSSESSLERGSRATLQDKSQGWQSSEKVLDRKFELQKQELDQKFRTAGQENSQEHQRALVELQHTQALERQENEQNFRTNERVGSQGFTAEQNDKNRDTNVMTQFGVLPPVAMYDTQSGKMTTGYRTPKGFLGANGKPIDESFVPFHEGMIPKTGEQPGEWKRYRNAVGEGSFHGDFPEWMEKFETKSTKNEFNMGPNEVGANMQKRFENIEPIVTGINAIREARRAVNDPGGGYFGAGAELKEGFGSLYASITGDTETAKRVENTQTFKSALAPAVGAMLRATVGSSALSEGDRKFAQQAVGADATLTKDSINRIMNIMEKYNVYRLQDYRKRLNKVYPDKEKQGQQRAMYDIEMPAPLGQKEIGGKTYLQYGDQWYDASELQ
jgi:hypothetical protein